MLRGTAILAVSFTGWKPVPRNDTMVEEKMR